MKKQYMEPFTEVVVFGAEGDIMEDFNVGLSGYAAPEDAESKGFDLSGADDDGWGTSFTGKSLWDD